MQAVVVEVQVSSRQVLARLQEVLQLRVVEQVVAQAQPLALLELSTEVAVVVELGMTEQAMVLVALVVLVLSFFATLQRLQSAAVQA
jgi:hypothetical protein